ncbi:hypothetical protein Tco_1578609 [Tanacetum coccineum]
MHILNDQSFFLTNKTGAPQGEELGLMKPLLESSCSCSDNSFISDGASRYGARATGVAPGIKSIWNSTGRAEGCFDRDNGHNRDSHPVVTLSPRQNHFVVAITVKMALKFSESAVCVVEGGGEEVMMNKSSLVRLLLPDVELCSIPNGNSRVRCDSDAEKTDLPVDISVCKETLCECRILSFACVCSYGYRRRVGVWTGSFCWEVSANRQGLLYRPIRIMAALRRGALYVRVVCIADKFLGSLDIAWGMWIATVHLRCEGIVTRGEGVVSVETLRLIEDSEQVRYNVSGLRCLMCMALVKFKSTALCRRSAHECLISAVAIYYSYIRDL